MPKSQKLKQGYIFAIKDPDTGKYIYLGISQRPWELIYRMSTYPIQPQLYEWFREFYSKHPLGVEILGEIIADRFHAKLRNEPMPSLPEDHPYRIRIEWDILGIQENEEQGNGSYDPASASLKTRIMNKLLAEGHPLIRRKQGRPHWKRLGLPDPGLE